MRPSTMARLALWVIVVGFLLIVTAHEGLGFLLGVTTFAAAILGLGGLIVAATGSFDK